MPILDLIPLKEAIRDLFALDPDLLGHGETVLELEALLAQTEAVTVRAAAAFDASGEWSVDGAKSCASWVAGKTRMPMPVVKRQIRLGRALRHLPEFAASWGDGRICGAHVEAVDKVRRFETEDVLARDEPLLAMQAERLTFAHFAKAVRYWEQVADPGGVEKSAEQLRAARDAWLVATYEGMWLGKMTLDPISGAIVSSELERIEKELFEEEWAYAKKCLGREPIIAELSRTTAQRRADALVEMACRSATCPEDGRRPRPLFTVLVGYETLHGRVLELAQGAPVTPGSLVRFLDQCDIERVVFEPGARVEVSERTRLFTGATRRALEVRDRECTHPLCDEQIQRCQADHIEPFSQGGLTTQENGRILCAFHNRLRNRKLGRDQDERPPPGR